MVNVLFIAYYFPPIGGAGVQRTVKFVRYIPESGYLPVIVTGPGRAPGRWTPVDAGLTSEIPSYVRTYRAESPAPREGNNPIVDRLRNLLCLNGAFSKWWIDSAVSSGKRAISDQKIDLIYASMSPFESAVAARLLSSSFGIPWVADLRDPWVLDEMQVFRSYLHRKVHLRRMRSSLSSASAIIMNTNEASVALKRAFTEFSTRKIFMIPNGFDREDFSRPVPPRSDKKFRIVHTGYLHTELGLDLERKRRLLEALGGIEKGVQIFTRSHIFLVKAIGNWIESCPEVVKDLEVLFVGISTEGDRLITKQSPVSEIFHFTGYLPHHESISLVRTADLLFLPMHKLKRGQRATIVPGKVYEYMASERPILAAVPEGDAKDYLLASKTAFVCEPDDADGMAKILGNAYYAWKHRKPLATPDPAFLARFERRLLASELAKVFGSVL